MDSFHLAVAMSSGKLVVGSRHWVMGHSQWVVLAGRGQWTVVKDTAGKGDLPALSQSGTVKKKLTMSETVP
jgi:hypothetical protein